MVDDGGGGVAGDVPGDGGAAGDAPGGGGAAGDAPGGEGVAGDVPGDPGGGLGGGERSGGGEREGGGGEAAGVPGGGLGAGVPLVCDERRSTDKVTGTPTPAQRIATAARDQSAIFSLKPAPNWEAFSGASHVLCTVTWTGPSVPGRAWVPSLMVCLKV